MKKKLYYTVEKELQNIDGIEEATGNKTITTYSVVGGEIEEQFSFESLNEDSSTEAIEDYLIDNGMGDDEFELILL
jgi:hypothetical protein